MTAIELLAAFSGQTAEQWQQHFQYSRERRITSIEIYAFGMHDTTARYSGRDEPGHEVHNVLRIRTADGQEGVSGVDTCYSAQHRADHLVELQGIAAELAAIESSDPVEIGEALARTRPDLGDAVLASIDIALWDLAARRAGIPLYELLGAKRDSIETYASLPFYESLPEYIDAVREYAALGYQAFKLHVWGSIEKDLRLVDRLEDTFSGASYQFMIDLEGAYAFEDALRLGQRMENGMFVWLEAPIKDALLDEYAALREKLAVDVIPAGYDIYSAEFISQGIAVGAWDAARFSATGVGGISRALELLTIANDSNTPVEIQSWGHALAQAANLHLMLANERTRYFEVPMPGQVFEFGVKEGLAVANGRVVAPGTPGLGVDMRWDQVDKADFFSATTMTAASLSAV